MAASSKSQWASALLGASAVAAGCILWRRRRCALRDTAIVTQLNVYPVKSCRGIALETAELDAGGIAHDREWMIVRRPGSGHGVKPELGPMEPSWLLDEATADMLTIREYPRMATIQPAFTSQGYLMLCTDDGKSIVVEDSKDGVEFTSCVWRTQVLGVDQGDDVADFLTAFLDCLDAPVRLMRMKTAGRRLIDCSKYHSLVESDDDLGGSSRFCDWAQLSIISIQSLSWLNAQERISGGMTNARTRMNIVVDAAEAFAEERWDTFSVGQVGCRFLKRCGRCAIPTVDPATGAQDAKLEPLKTLKRLRRGEYPFLEAGTSNEAFLGVNVRHYFKPGQSIRVGDRVAVTGRNAAWA